MKHVLDKGYLKLINSMGSDVDVVNAARASFEKEVSDLSLADEKLISYLVKNKHDSTLRHCVMTFEVYAPLMVARQWWKHVVASSHLDDQVGHNETSRRYVSENEQFYLPTVWRSKPDSAKQGSGGPVDDELGANYTKLLEWHQAEGLELYRRAIDDGIAPEQARVFLAAYGLYVRWRWTASLNAVMHFLALRQDEHAQSEITEYSNALESYVNDIYPVTYAAWKQFR